MSNFDPIWHTLFPQMLRKLRGIRVTGGTCINTDESLTINIPPRTDVGGGGGDSFIWIRITGHTQDGSNKRWLYDWERVEKSTGGYGGWTTFTGGPSGASTDWGSAYNGVEDRNGATGLMGIGVTLPLTGSNDIQPLPNDSIVLARVVYPLDGSLPEVWIIDPNGVDGSCS